MDWVHCNKCFKFYKDCRIHITSCGHLTCGSCVSAAKCCPMCGKQCQTMDINSNMPPDMQDLFRDSRDLATALMKDLSSTMEFQAKNRNHFDRMRSTMDYKERAYLDGAYMQMNGRMNEIEAAKSEFKAVAKDFNACQAKKESIRQQIQDLADSERMLAKRLAKRVSENRVHAEHKKPPLKRSRPEKDIFGTATVTQAPDLESLFSSPCSTNDDVNPTNMGCDISMSDFATSTPITILKNKPTRQLLQKLFAGGQVLPSPIGNTSGCLNRRSFSNPPDKIYGKGLPKAHLHGDMNPFSRRPC